MPAGQLTPMVLRMLAWASLALAAACAPAPEPAAVPETPAVAAAPAMPATPAPIPSATPAAIPLPPEAPRITPGPVEPLEIATARGPVKFQVEMADTPAEQQQGLMWRGSMPADRGMIFDFHTEDARSFWMRNTYIPLDIIFIRADGRILSIAQNTTPLSEAPVPSFGAARAVLEINGGLAETLGIRPGDRVRHRIFP